MLRRYEYGCGRPSSSSSPSGRITPIFICPPQCGHNSCRHLDWLPAATPNVFVQLHLQTLTKTNDAIDLSGRLDWDRLRQDQDAVVRHHDLPAVRPPSPGTMQQLEVVEVVRDEDALLLDGDQQLLVVPS